MSDDSHCWRCRCCSAAERELRHCVSTFDDEIEGSKLIECSWSFDCCQESCYRFDSSSSKGSTSNFREWNGLIFEES